MLIDIFDKTAQHNVKFGELASEKRMIKHIKGNRQLFKKLGDFTTLQNFNAITIASFMNHSLSKYVKNFYGIFRSWNIFEKNSIFIDEFQFENNNLFNSRILNKMRTLLQDFKKNKIKFKELDTKTNRIVTKTLNYSKAIGLIKDESYFISSTMDLFSDLLKDTYVNTPKQNTILLSNSWLFFNDEFWANSYTFFKEYNNLLLELINEQTFDYFKKNIKVNNPYKYLMDIRNKLDPNNKIKNKLIQDGRIDTDKTDKLIK